MGRVFFNTRLNFHKLTATYQMLASDSGKTFLIHPAADSTLTLPTLATAGEGWHCKVVLTEDTDGSDGGMGAKVNIDCGADNDVVGMLVSADNVAGDYALNDDDFIGFTGDASPGDMVEIFTDGNRWYVHGMVKDSQATDVKFHTDAV